MITILSQIYEEDCTSTCYTTSGCSDSNSATRSTNACTYSPYWNDPAIESSLSSLLAQFPFTFPEAVNITTTSTRTTGNILSSTSRSQSTSTSKSSSTFKSTGISTAKSSSTSKTTSSQASASKTSTELDVPPKATPTLLLAAKRKRCHNEGPEENYIPPFPYKRRDTVFCAADQTPKSGFGLFKWDAIDTEKLKQVCESLVNRKIVLKYEAFYLHSDRYGFDNGECYKRKGKGLADGNNLRVLFRVTKDKRGCSGEGTSDSCRLSDDPYCEKDFSFADYGVDKCVQNFQKLNKCKGNTWDDKSEYDTAGGTYYYDCVSWTVVAMNAVRTPPDTDDPLPEDP
ncbi:uncharacterized protein HMPREF1541_03595 [Cyphellophora europaea CBS 101466]|uniref:Uncharacterized protein n=1 Tax=Cyphellophora europaea (strain CBS 101466) TaxID=1220924 RepID=W2S110_CYPE1|nr:uncharacterized protein HMPREF1541_03595 [Cyphellophora europaea CBS 101466]ETN41659.1 hypothetical protein HMPREF1541_03595 [Cyphellophora europaea CBS 101466]